MCGDLDNYDGLIVGTAGDDVLEGGNGRQVLVGLGGDDVLSGGNHNDCVVGGPGDDVLAGGNGLDLLFGQDGSDHLDGGTGKDLLDAGGDPGDTCLSEGAPDVLVGCDDDAGTSAGPRTAELGSPQPPTARLRVPEDSCGCGKRPVAARGGAAPVTAPDAVTVYAGGYAPAEVLANDTDPEGDRLSVCGVGPRYQGHIDLDTENPKRIGVLPGGRTEPGTYVYTYLACDGASQTPGTLTVTVPAPPRVTVRAVPGRPGKVRARTDADFRIRLTYGSPGEDQDGLVFIPKHGSVTFGTRYDRLNWTARLTDGTLLFRGVVKDIY
ncbi:calcium-binding protein [Nocardioides anomalus]|uniref:Calcium-binding protein n=2 Tax=Nocardioides anomalus TaxID=2712223 RepID=A0A6G6WKE1_9ACTN|nr:calcium-binding protein [Nocardioides anomalus]